MIIKCGTIASDQAYISMALLELIAIRTFISQLLSDQFNIEEKKETYSTVQNNYDSNNI